MFTSDQDSVHSMGFGPVLLRKPGRRQTFSDHRETSVPRPKNDNMFARTILVGGFIHDLYDFHNIWDVILLIDFHIFQDG